MAVREVDEVEFLSSQQVTKAVNAMLANPEARQLVLRAQKIIAPDAVIPELDAKKPIDEALAKVNDQLAAMAAERAAEKAERLAAEKTNEFTQGWERQKASLRGDGWMDEGLVEVEKFAQEQGIPNLKAAAALYEKEHPPEAPVQPNGFGSWDLFQPDDREGEQMKALLESGGDDEMALRSMVDGALKEARSGRRA